MPSIGKNLSWQVECFAICLLLYFENLKKESVMSVNKEFALGVLLAVGAILLLKNPRCNRGCKNLAQHILSHGVDDILGALLA